MSKWKEFEQLAQDEFFNKGLDLTNLEIIACDGVPCGYAQVEDKDEYLFGKELVLLPEYQRRGIGTKFLAGLIEKAKSRHLPIRIQALKANKALELYHRLGFRDVGVTETHVELEFDPDQDASVGPLGRLLRISYNTLKDAVPDWDGQQLQNGRTQNQTDQGKRESIPQLHHARIKAAG